MTRKLSLYSFVVLSMTALLATGARAMTPENLVMTRNVAERGNESAQVLLAIAYLNGDGGLARDGRQAAHWFEKAALQGNGYAEGRLADLYAEGTGVPKNLQLAADWRKRAANRGVVDAQRKLGQMYMAGQGVPQDFAAARDWLQKAAAGGDSEAAYLLARLYRRGLGGDVDADAAGNWLARSAAQGYIEAIKLLHALKSFGQHFDDADRTLSLHGLHKLAADGDVDAQYQLGLHYEAGSGGEPKDLGLAAQWFSRAAAQGNEASRRALSHIQAGQDRPQPGTAQRP